jgi:hypothetical protein
MRRAASRIVRNPPNADISIADGFRVEFGNRAVRAGAGVVVHDIGFAEPVIRLCEQVGYCSRIGCVDGEGLGAGLIGQCRQLLNIPRRQSDAKAGCHQPSRK